MDKIKEDKEVIKELPKLNKKYKISLAFAQSYKDDDGKVYKKNSPIITEDIKLIEKLKANSHFNIKEI